MLQTIPVTSSPNQTLQTTLNINNKNITIGLTLRFNEMANYWVMTISNPSTNAIILDSIPLFSGIYPAGNLLQQFQYLAIGEWYVINVSGIPSDKPTSSNLGTDYILVVGDNK
jgi:methyl coenzyme M reductase beta subunit